MAFARTVRAGAEMQMAAMAQRRRAENARRRGEAARRRMEARRMPIDRGMGAEESRKRIRSISANLARRFENLKLIRLAKSVRSASSSIPAGVRRFVSNFRRVERSRAYLRTPEGERDTIRKVVANIGRLAGRFKPRMTETGMKMAAREAALKERAVQPFKGAGREAPARQRQSGL